MPRWIFLVLLAFAAYVAWRKFGGKLTSAITNIAK